MVPPHNLSGVSADQHSDDGSEEAPERLWVPQQGELGLLQALHVMSGGGNRPVSLVLSGRPPEELCANFLDHSGKWINLDAEPYRSGTARLDTTGTVDSVRWMLNVISREDAYVVVRYLDYSPWAAANCPDSLRGGFGMPSEGDAFGVVLSPFARPWVERPLVLRVGKDPAVVVAEISEAQFAAAAAKAHRARAERRQTAAALTRVELEAVLHLGSNFCEPRDTTLCQWVGGRPRDWPAEQLFACSAAAAMLLGGAWRGCGQGEASERPSRLQGFVSVAFALAGGASAAFFAGLCAARGVHRHVPWAGLSAGAVALPLLHADQRSRRNMLGVHIAALYVASYQLSRRPLPEPEDIP
eukprot:TRINITY_DN55831_c0_g1_i1.p1 TRINITY_DN55831_c0_g1~~TRINITY_DN55831_c0_g1_i1.p1  ORF type:complete len:382 (+),score=93.93 TRINITY_DN55831_c0_g1_i1:81-1148(+)